MNDVNLGRVLFEAIYPRAKTSFRTLKELSLASGVSVGLLSEANSGRRNPSVKVAHALAKASKFSWTLHLDKDGKPSVKVGPQSLFPTVGFHRVCAGCGKTPRKPRNACGKIAGRMLCRSCRDKVTVGEPLALEAS